jgi:AbrB family looped-hinge helix DNA binding protein
MFATIDSGGRVVIPKSIRERLGLHPGRALAIIERDGHVEIEPAPTPMKLVRRRGILVAEPTESLPMLTDDAVRETIERTRR